MRTGYAPYIELGDGTRCRVRGLHVDRDQLTAADLHALDTFAAALRRIAAGDQADDDTEPDTP